MKRIGSTYNQICSVENVQLALSNAMKGKSHYKDVRKVRQNPSQYVDGLHHILSTRSFKNAPYKSFERVENGKSRVIYKLPFYPDRILHHAICQVLEPIWTRTYIRDTYACIKGRGIHDGVRRMKKSLQSDPIGTQYCLKIDITKFYPSVDNHIMKEIVAKRLKCADTLALLNEIIDSTQGLPIGNYLSQHLSNLYLSDFDHYCKEDLGIKYYFRYCDDIVILGSSKSELHELKKLISTYLKDRLSLQIKRNWQVFPVCARGIDFLGYRFYHSHALLRKRIASRFKAKMRRIKKSGSHTSEASRSTMAAYNGWLKHGNCHNLKRSHYETVQ